MVNLYLKMEAPSMKVGALFFIGFAGKISTLTATSSC